MSERTYSNVEIKHLDQPDLGVVLEEQFPANAPEHNLPSGKRCSGSGKPLKRGGLAPGNVPVGFCENSRNCQGTFERAGSI